MAQTPQTFLVTGATGQQGGAVARELLSSGHAVIALVRDPSKPAALKLAQLGAHLVPGDHDDVAALATAAHGCDGVFLLTKPTAAWTTEVQHARNIISAARTAHVPRIVYSSVTRAEQHETFPDWDPQGLTGGYWRAKTQIQELVQAAGFESWTILQPAWMMPNFVAPVSQWYFPELATERVLVTAFEPETQLHLTDPLDIGRFAARALTSRTGELGGEIVKLACEEMTMGQVVAEMSRVSGTELKAVFRSDAEVEEMKGTDRLVAAQVWQRLSGSMVDMAKVKEYGVPLSSWRGFLEREKDALDKALET